MKLYVEQDGRIGAAGDPADVLATVRRVNPLAGESPLEGAAAPRVLTWSGTLADALFEPHPANWLRPGQETLREACRVMTPQLAERNMTACFHPHCRHVLSDAPSCVAFLDDMADAPFEIALAPATMLEPSMMPDLDDHLRRMFETLGSRVSMVLLSDLAEGAGGTIEPAPLGHGLLRRDTVASLLSDNVPGTTPIVAAADDLDVARVWLSHG